MYFRDFRGPLGLKPEGVRGSSVPQPEGWGEEGARVRAEAREEKEFLRVLPSLLPEGWGEEGARVRAKARGGTGLPKSSSLPPA